MVGEVQGRLRSAATSLGKVGHSAIIWRVILWALSERHVALSRGLAFSSECCVEAVAGPTPLRWTVSCVLLLLSMYRVSFCCFPVLLVAWRAVFVSVHVRLASSYSLTFVALSSFSDVTIPV